MNFSQFVHRFNNVWTKENPWSDVDIAIEELMQRGIIFLTENGDIPQKQRKNKKDLSMERDNNQGDHNERKLPTLDAIIEYVDK